MLQRIYRTVASLCILYQVVPIMCIFFLYISSVVSMCPGHYYFLISMALIMSSLVSSRITVSFFPSITVITSIHLYVTLWTCRIFFLSPFFVNVHVFNLCRFGGRTWSTTVESLAICHLVFLQHSHSYASLYVRLHWWILFVICPRFIKCSKSFPFGLLFV